MALKNDLNNILKQYIAEEEECIKKEMADGVEKPKSIIRIVVEERLKQAKGEG